MCLFFCIASASMGGGRGTFAEKSWALGGAVSSEWFGDVEYCFLVG